LKALFCIIFCCFLFGNFSFAQQKKKSTKKVLEIKPKIKTVARPDSIAPFIISAEGDTINRTDDFNTKQGLWIENIPEKYGEVAMLKFGFYKDDWKTGKWKLYEGPNLICIENYKNNVLDGEIMYYENGFVSCRGYYSGSNYRTKFDTIVLENAQTNETKTYIIRNNSSTVKDSTWTFYLPNSEKVKSIEYWRNDEMIGGQEINNGVGVLDSATKEAYKKFMPLNGNKVVAPFENNNKGQTRDAKRNRATFRQGEKLK
jgi:hypothetical protein